MKRNEKSIVYRGGATCGPGRVWILSIWRGNGNLKFLSYLTDTWIKTFQWLGLIFIFN
jgi:hypothetical protein